MYLQRVTYQAPLSLKSCRLLCSAMSESPIMKVPKDDPGPREDNLGWAEYFMALAHVTAMRSKDPSTQVRFSLAAI
ncbi:hypothetical protein FOZ63_000394 [Perkinsus olseni]|uniref:Uncharacterized protein n=1 Tax=Perkinsus olseni TaxID=32597 RepID=A0A7J6T942_PEROL|nr:hypothetical protein FOZ63_000394 [Perkinsus olseni]